MGPSGSAAYAHFQTEAGVDLWHPGQVDHVFTNVKVPYALAKPIVFLDFIVKQGQCRPYDLGKEAEQQTGMLLQADEWSLVCSLSIMAGHAKPDGDSMLSLSIIPALSADEGFLSWRNRLQRDRARLGLARLCS